MLDLQGIELSSFELYLDWIFFQSGLVSLSSDSPRAPNAFVSFADEEPNVIKGPVSEKFQHLEFLLCLLV